eukprot:gene15628-biopygen5849
MGSPRQANESTAPGPPPADAKPGPSGGVGPSGAAPAARYQIGGNFLRSRAPWQICNAETIGVHFEEGNCKPLRDKLPLASSRASEAPGIFLKFSNTTGGGGGRKGAGTALGDSVEDAIEWPRSKSQKQSKPVENGSGSCCLQAELDADTKTNGTEVSLLAPEVDKYTVKKSGTVAVNETEAANALIRICDPPPTDAEAEAEAEHGRGSGWPFLARGIDQSQSLTIS